MFSISTPASFGRVRSVPVRTSPSGEQLPSVDADT